MAGMKKPKTINKTANTESAEASTFRLLEDVDHVRKRPGMYIPNKDYTIFELVDNGVDILVNDNNSHKYKNKIITVSIDNEGKTKVTDNAGGMPIEEAPDMPGYTIAELCLSRLKAGTKFEDGVKSAGLNGVGASCINFLSEYFDVNIYKDGKEYEMKFEKGVVTQKLKEIGTCSKSKHGTHVTCLPDKEIWADLNDYNITSINNRMRQLCYLNPELTIKVDIDYDGKSIHETYNYPDGVKSYIEELTKNAEVIHEPWQLTKKDVSLGTKTIKIEDENGEKIDKVIDVKCDLDIAFVYTESYTDNIYAFTNNVINTDGKSSNLTGFKRGIATAIKESYEENNPKSNITLSAEDTREGIVAVVSVKVPDPNYIGQGKDYLNMPKVASAIYGEIKEFIDDQLDKMPNERDNILNRAAQAYKVREAAHKAKETARKIKKMGVGKVEKLTQCKTKDPVISEIFFVEGDSAAGAAKNSRDKNVQAILPVFGKIPNTEEMSIDKVLSSDKLKDIINALECNIDEDFDIEKLRYHKIIIMSDADVDGYHIATLYITFFWRHMRPLIENGYVYLSVPPLYRIEFKGSNKEEYATTDEELQKILKENENKKLHVTYLKGLGEMSEEGLWQSTMNPENRTLIQITAEDVEAANNTVAMCMNTKMLNAEKKNYIMTEEELELI